MIGRPYTRGELIHEGHLYTELYSMHITFTKTLGTFSLSNDFHPGNPCPVQSSFIVVLSPVILSKTKFVLKSPKTKR